MLKSDSNCVKALVNAVDASPFQLPDSVSWMLTSRVCWARISPSALSTCWAAVTIAALLTVTSPATAAPPGSASVRALPCTWPARVPEPGAVRLADVPAPELRAGSQHPASERDQFWPSPDNGVNQDRQLRLVTDNIHAVEIFGGTCPGAH